MIRKPVSVLTVLLFLAAFAGSVFAQTGNASLGGTVQDPSKALIPGVTVTATNTETNVTVSQVTNESGAYSFPVLQPGTYRVTAELPGFKKAIHDKLQLGYATQSRDDFTLEVGAVTSTVEVTSTAVSLLRETSASVGDVLTEERLRNLPMVGNNVLGLLSTLPGINFGGNFDPGSNLGTDNSNTVAGLNMNTVNVTRDGLAMNDTRYAATTYGSQAFTSTRLNPDLIGEIRLILSPVDAELGRGNAQVQISTRSGTNRYSGAANWSVRNSALDANTWTNNHTPFTDPNTNVVTNKTLPAWNNLHEYSISYGGPVKFPGLYDGKNKTFFYGLVSGQVRNTRETTNVNVLTDTARLGIYRYWTGYNPTGWNANNTTLSQTYPVLASSATYPAVDYAGNPVAPPKNPDGTPYTGKLTCFSVFGTKRLDASFNLVPFTPADCAGGSISVPSTANGLWDAFRTTQDLSGYIKKVMEGTPHATYFGSGDGLNIAQFRWQRRRDGNNTNNAEVGGDLYTNYRQYNLKIDHNFNSRHKASVNWTYQPEKSADNVAQYPGGISGEIKRSVYVVTANVTSTLTSRMINEARFGVNHNFEYDNPAWFSTDPATRQKAEDILMRGSPSTLNPSYTYLAVVNNGVGNVNNSSGYMDTAVSSLITLNPLWNYADTLSWSKGKHSYKFGYELRLPRTSGNGALQTYPTISLGNNASATSTASPFATSTNFATELPGLLNSALTGSGATAARTNVTSLLYYLTGSVNQATHQYWVNSADNVQNGLWSDFSTSGQRLRKQVWNEQNAFVKDDYKITKHLTLNLGVRWEFASAPYIDGGFTAAFKDFGYGAFGATRTAQTTLDAFNNDPFSIFLKPGNLFLTGYGSNPTTAPLSCQVGVKQNALLPASTCNPDAMSAILFVGPGSPNPSLKSEPESRFDIGPAVGFAYTLPWFGEGKTTIRGGYQQTFGAAQAVRNNVPGGTEAEIANAPGAAASATTVVSDPTFQSILNTRALNLTDVKALVPVRPTTTPGLPVPIYGRFAGGAGGINVYDPNYKTPYTQNVNLSVTRQITRTTTLDIRYIGTFARNTKGNINLNTANVYDNPELFQALTDARAGTCTASAAAYKANYTDKGINPCDAAGDPVFLDQILAGLNINTATTSTDSSGVTRTYGNVGTVVNEVFQSGAQQLRRSATFQGNLANGDFFAVTNSLLGLAPTAAQGRQAAPINPATGGGLGGVAMIAMRNGCDRIANGFQYVQQPTTTTFTTGYTAANATPLRCFPEDFLISNPQLGNITYISNYGHNNYHSLQVGVSARPINGVTTQATWVWAKAMNQPATTFFDPADRNRNFGAQANNLHTLRMNGTVELPIGPNKFLLGNSSGLLARLLERWQTSFIANFASGTPASVSPGTNHCYRATGTCRYNVTADWVQPVGKVDWNTVNPNTGAITGSFYGNPAPFTGVPDPQCVNPSIVTPGDKMGTSLVTSSTGTAVCSIVALAQRNPDGTTGKYLLTYSMPGEIGNSGNNNVQLFGTWSLDMNFSKTFRVSESKSFQVRIDSTNVLNHPVPNTPSLSAGGGLGTISGKGNQTRKMQGQLRITF